VSGGAEGETVGPEDRPPMLVIDGNATAEEVAAVVAVLQGMAAAAASAEPGRRPRSLWADPSRGVRRTPENTPAAGLWPGAGGSAWRASALPR
jgi:hypothetical protein